MTASGMREAIALVLVAASGWALLRRFAPSFPPSLRTALAWPIGSGVVSAAALACVLAGLPLGFATLAPLVVLAVAALGPARGSEKPAVCAEHLACAAIVAIAAAAALGYRLTAPFPGWDGAGIWGLKARALLMGTLPPTEALTAYSQPEYPLHLPLVAAWLGAARGGWSDGALLSVCWAGYVSLALLLVQLTRRGSGAPAWLLVAGILPLGGLISQVDQGTADLTLGALVAGLLVCLHRWLEQQEGAALWVAGVLTGLAAWTKFEGVVLAALAWAAVAVVSRSFGRRRDRLVLPATLGAALAAPWYIGLLLRQVPVDSMSLSGAERLARLPVVLSAATAEFLSLERWGLLWFAACAAIVLASLRRDREGAVPASILAGAAVAYALVYVASPHPALDVYLRASLPRILIPLVPAATMLVASGAAALGPGPGGRAAPVRDESRSDSRGR